MRNFVRAAMAVVMCLGVGVAGYGAIQWVDEDTIFVGKGDVQLACNLNNAGAQSLLATIGNDGWAVQQVSEYEAVCEWVTGPAHNRVTHQNTYTETAAVVGTVEYSPRNANQITGIFLAVGEFEGSGEIPVVGEPCQGGGTDAKWVEVTLLGEASTDPTVMIDCTGGNNPTTVVGQPF